MPPIRTRRPRLETLEKRHLLAAGVGLTAQYYSDTELTSLQSTRIESQLQQDWGSGAPMPELNVDHFSARYSGTIEAQATGLHTFMLNAEVGARLWINGQKLIDRWSDHTIASATVGSELIAGRRYDIVLEIRETTGVASFQLQWVQPNLGQGPIMTGQLFPSERGTLERRQWTGVAGSMIDDLTALPGFPDSPGNVNWLESFETNTSGQSAFGQQLIGLLYPPTTGHYRFYIAGDEAAELWLSNSESAEGKQRVAWVTQPTGFRQWTHAATQQSAMVWLVAGQAYAIEALHKQAAGDDHVSIGWTKPGQSTIDVIEGQYLAPPLPTVTLFSSRPEAIEGDSIPLEFVVKRSGTNVTNPLTVAYMVRGTATSELDYSPLSGSVTIPAGQTSASILVNPLSDQLLESNESVIVELLDGPGYAVSWKSQRSSIGTIQNAGSALPGGTIVSPAMLLGNYQYFGGSYSQVTPPSPLGQAIQATISTVPPDRWDAQLKFAFNQPLLQGDVLWAEFYARSLSGSASITAVAEKNSAPYTKSLDQGLTIGTDWTRIQLPFVALESYSAGQATFGFFLGAQVQTVQIADVSVRNYGPSRNITPTQYGLNNIGGTWGYIANVPVSGQAFATATEITTVNTPPNNDSWRLQYGGRNSAAVRQGDTLRFEFYARGSSGADPRIGIAIQTTDVFDTLTYQQINLTSTWQHYSVQTTLNAVYDVQGLQAMLNVGFAPQSVQVAAIGWTNLSAAANMSELPTLVPPTSYAGRGADEPWRDAAEQRIAAERQAAMTVHVVDTSGNPVEGAVVSIQQTRHSFMFGSAIDGANNLLSPAGGPDALKYQSEIKRLFNTVTIENSMKWPNFLQNSQPAIDVANWVVQNGLALRGHNVLWPSRHNMPSQIWDQYDSIFNSQGNVAAANYLRQATSDRVQTAISTFAGQAFEWDIVNEPYDNNDVMQILGSQVVIDWFLQARQIDPNVSRVLNDYDIFSRNGQNLTHRANFDNWLALLVANNAIERMGEQSHYNEGTLTGIDILGQLIESYYSQFNLPIAITEFDIDTTNAQLQADYLRDYMTMAFSQAAVDQFIQWGFWSQAHWKPASALYNADFSIRPHGQVYEDLVFGQWWTDRRGTTWQGQYSTHVTKGDYLITVTHGSHSTTHSLLDFTQNGSLTIVVNQIPVIADQTFSLNENSAASPGAVQASDSDAGQNLTYTILAGNEANRFAISPTTGVISVLAPGLMDFETQASYQLIVQVSDNGTPSQSATARVTIQLLDLPEMIGEVVIGDGTQQRSLVERVSMYFDGPLTIEPGAFQVTRQGTTEVVTTQVTQSLSPNGQTVVTLTFSGQYTRGNRALLDGYYRLAINGTKIRRGANTLDINSDGAGGDTKIVGDVESDKFFALYADANGDGLVGVAEFAQFRESFGKVRGTSGYNEIFDYELNNAVGVSDFAEFRNRFGKAKLAFPPPVSNASTRHARLMRFLS